MSDQCDGTSNRLFIDELLYPLGDSKKDRLIHACGVGRLGLGKRKSRDHSERKEVKGPHGYSAYLKNDPFRKPCYILLSLPAPILRGRYPSPLHQGKNCWQKLRTCCKTLGFIGSLPASRAANVPSQPNPEESYRAYSSSAKPVTAAGCS